MIKKIADLEVFQISYQLAMDVFNLTRLFPKEEKYSLTDQIVRSSRSVSANIAEGWGKRVYENDFKRHLVCAIGSLEETKAWFLFAKDCGYLSAENYQDFNSKSEVLGAGLYKLFENWKSF